jgi:hypothetical protein
VVIDDEPKDRLGDHGVRVVMHGSVNLLCRAPGC